MCSFHISRSNPERSLSSQEQQVVAALRAGSVANIGQIGLHNAQQAQLDTEFLRKILRGFVITADEIDPIGLQISGADFDKELNLDDISFPLPITFTNCTFSCGISARRASLHLIELRMVDIRSHKGQNTDKIAVDVSQANISHDLKLLNCKIDGGISVYQARIGGDAFFLENRCINNAGPAIIGGELTVGRNARLTGEYSGEGDAGAVMLNGARVGERLYLADIELTNNHGPALAADAITTGGNVFLGGQFHGAGEQGAVRFLGGHIREQLHCEEGEFTNDCGPALFGDMLEVGNDVHVGGRFTGSSSTGILRLMGASIGGQLQLKNGTVTNETGPALAADGIAVKGNLFLNATSLKGAGQRGTVRLYEARVGRSLYCNKTRVLASDTDGSLELTGLRIEGEIHLDPDFRVASTPGRWLSINGLTYSGLPEGVATETWVRILREETTSYAPQPWQHFAAALRSAGHEDEARCVLVAQKDEFRRRVLYPERTRGLSARIRYERSILSKALVGYGFLPSRAVRGFLILIAIGVLSGLATGLFAVDWTGSSPHQTVTATVAAHQLTPGGPIWSCSSVERMGLGLSWVLPIIPAEASGGCTLNTSDAAGQVIAVWSWILICFGWIYGALVAAAFTGVLQRVSRY